MGEKTNVEMSKQFVWKKPSLAAFLMSLNDMRFQIAVFVWLGLPGSETANIVKCAVLSSKKKRNLWFVDWVIGLNYNIVFNYPS